MKLQISRLLLKRVLYLHVRRCLNNTVSPLTADFNSKPSKKFNLIGFREANVGLFKIPELTGPEGFQILEEKCKQEVASLVNEACDPHRKRKMVTIFDEMSDSICRVADMMEFLRISHPDAEYRDAAEKTCLTMSKLVEKLNTNLAIYKALKSVVQNGDVQELTDVDKRVANLFLFDFEQSGIHLDESVRERFVKINNAILRICNNFMHATQQPTPRMDFQIDPELMKGVSVEGGATFINSLQSEHFSEAIREVAYRIYLHPNSYTEDLLTDMLQGRKLIAKLTGFETFAERALKGTLVESPENAWKFLETIAENFREGAKQEYEIMHRFKQEKKESDSFYVRNDDIMPWDPPYFTSTCRRKLYDEENISNYFSLGVCMEGLNMLFQSLFDVTLENLQPEAGEVWHYDVYKLAVEHRTEGTLGYIYCDFFDRSDKPNQDCHFTIHGGRMKEDGEYQLPIVVLHLNFTFPGTFTPTLLTPAQLENLFHEFGHAMHSMLGRTQYQHVTGTRCPIDFAEVPSVLMEYFVSDPRVLTSFAKHYKTGAPLQGVTLQNFCKSKRLFLYSELQLQVFYALVDQAYHGSYTNQFNQKTTTDILREIQNKYYGIPYVENTAWQLRFGHLVGYGGKYYSYLMSRAVASRIWRQFFKANPFNRENGERYRRELLAHGGERHPSELIEALLGEKPTIEMLTDSLIEDLKQRSLFPM
ncbi:mitochondrial intermediate peptidase-like [Mercenaria mercenaria]|uniref:mitochondrial intermediate peptidase-like n=1 Tax=Mercenaria mercenaria TaxID=6596 RepID=UPI00234EC346|nr:mitochondrial intermediate peptidase-like [Mercenaria mercenaria]XP_053404675.1 mitochondrial intermediate peptidase-like [Mercenaria mercenaria]XP_053404676.1 mitochondrial intermediate peptidase-like [Mercenaria mercenaria]